MDCSVRKALPSPNWHSINPPLSMDPLDYMEGAQQICFKRQL